MRLKCSERGRENRDELRGTGRAGSHKSFQAMVHNFHFILTVIRNHWKVLSTEVTEVVNDLLAAMYKTEKSGTRQRSQEQEQGEQSGGHYTNVDRKWFVLRRWYIVIYIL